MKVMFIAGEISRTFGTGEYLYNFIKCLTSKGFTAYIVAKKIHQNTDIHARVIVLPSTFLNFLKTVRVLLRLLEIIKRNRIDVIHIATHSYPSLMFSLPVVLLTRISDVIVGRRRTKIFITIHDRIFVEGLPRSISEWTLYFLVKLTISFADLVIVPGKSIKKALFHMFGKRVYMKTVVLPICVPEDMLTKFDPNKYDQVYVRMRYNLPADAFIVSFFGSMDFKPNLMSALWLWKSSFRICEDFRRKHKRDLLVVIAGRHSEKLPRNDCFTSLGYIEDLTELFVLSDAIVIPHLPSHSGPHIKTLYALSSRKPLIATADGIKDFPEDIKKCVYLLDPMDASILATLIEKIWTDKYVDTEICTEYLSKFFSCSKLCDLYYKIYKTTITK